MSDTQVWSAPRVEELLFRQFMKNDDVSQDVPALPAKPAHGLYANPNDSVAALIKFAQTTPAAGAMNLSQKQNLAGGTPMKPPMTPTASTPTPRTPKPLNASKANAVAGGPKTPTAKRDRDDVMAAPKTPSSKQAAAGAKRERIEWPAGVPKDSALKSNSRSAVQHLTERRIREQEGIDPDLIFAQEKGDFPLMKVFTAHPKALKKIHQVRGLSGDWSTDTFSVAEEAAYKASMHFTVTGASQAFSGAF
jgi:hypothetical protein